MYGIDVKYYILGSSSAMELHFQQGFRHLKEFLSALSIEHKFIPVYLYVPQHKDGNIEQEYRDFIKSFAPDAIVRVYDYKSLQAKYSY